MIRSAFKFENSIVKLSILTVITEGTKLLPPKKSTNTGLKLNTPTTIGIASSRIKSNEP